MDVRCSSCGAIMESGSSECPACHSSGSGMVSSVGTGVATSDKDRTWLLAAHLSALAGILVPFGSIIGPLVVWLVKKNDSPVVAAAAKDALNFNISMAIYGIGAGLLTLILIGWLLVPVVAIAWIVFVVKGAMAASNNEPFKYPYSLNLVK